MPPLSNDNSSPNHINFDTDGLGYTLPRSSAVRGRVPPGGGKQARWPKDTPRLFLLSAKPSAQAGVVSLNSFDSRLEGLASIVNRAEGGTKITMPA